MKTLFHSMFLVLPLMFLSDRVEAFTFNPNTHIQVYYDYCGRDVYVKFVWFQSEGDNDKMLYFYFNHNPAVGAAQRIIDFRHLNYWPNNETGIDTLGTTSPYNNFGYKFPSSSFNFNVQFISTEIVTDNEGTKYWVTYRLNDLPQSAIETFSASGEWDGQGSGSPDYSISSTYPVMFVDPDAPSGLTATQGECGFVRIDWVNEESMACPGKEYYFRIMKDNLFLADLFAPSIAQTNFYYTDYFAPTGTGLAQNQHQYKVQLLLKEGGNGAIIQSSSFTGPVTGYPLPLPEAPTDLAVNYPNCTGSVNLTWQNHGLYESLNVTIIPTTGIPVIAFLDGTVTGYSGTINGGVTWTATVAASDICNQQAVSAPLGNIAVPEGPGPFSQNPPVENNGGIQLNWTPAVGATSYKITRQSSSGTTVIDINNGNTTSYLDTDIQVCTGYTYKITAFNTCGSTQTATLGAPIIQQSFAIWSDQKLTGSKGYYGNRVELRWDAPDNFAFDHFKIYRKVLGSSAEPTYLATINKNELLFTDFFAQAGILYEYSLSAYSDCNGEISQSNPLTDVGFRLPIATVSGNVKFETGTGVEGVLLTVERNAGTLGKGLHFDGQGAMTIHPNYSSDPIQSLPLMNEMSVEFWFRPDNLNSNYSLFNYVNGTTGYGLSYDASENVLIQYISDDGNVVAKKYPVSLSTQLFTHISWIRNEMNLSLYLDGVQQVPATAAYSSPGGSIPLTFGEQMSGYLDEIRFWNKAREAAEIQSDLHEILRGDEEHLIGYWRIDEGIGNGVYDISGVNDIYHGHHLQINNHVTWENTYPDGNQLGNMTLTDSVGNYVIKNIRYSGNGSTFTVIPFYSPGNTPHEFDPASTVLFLGEGNDVQNGVNFLDNSSFEVTGTIKYSLPDSMCDNTKCFIYVDDRVATINGQPAFVDPMTKTFKISVPIGLHKISVAQAGHVFHHGGQWPPTDTLYDFQKDESGITFYDSTRVRVIGRVVGGTREGNKKLGFNHSKNNIGTAYITFTSQIFGCHELTIETDSASGEYMVDLLPIRYNISIDIPNSSIDFGPLDILDLSIIRPIIHEVDSILNFAGQVIDIDSVPYQIKRNFIYRSMPEVDVVQADDMQPVRGDSIYIYVDPDTRDTTIIPLDPLPFPVFFAGKRYPTIISAFEPYFNNDDPMQVLEDRVPVVDGKITIRNGLGNEKGTGQSFDEVFEINNPGGTTPYTFIGGQPEFVEDANPSSNHSFTQTFELILETPDHTATWLPNGDLFRGYVLGSRPIDGSSFITEGPEMVDYILRDPPGDGSTASFSKGETYTSTKSWFTSTALSFGSKTKLKAGLQWFVGGGVVGIGFDTDIKNDNNLSYELKSTINADGEYTEESTFEQEISTNSDPFFPGDESDIYMGKSMNYLFGASEEFTLVPTSLCGVIDVCIGPELMVGNESYRLGKRKGLFLVPQGFKTTFVYSQLQIEDYLIPNLENLRNSLFVNESDKYVSHLATDDEGFGLNNDDPFFGPDVTSPDPLSTTASDWDGVSYTYTPPQGEIPDDRIRWYNQQIRLWQEAIGKNEEEKFKANLERNISFDANASLKYTHSSKSADKHSEKFEINIKTSADLFIGGIIGGSGGEFGFTLGLEAVIGGSFSQATESHNSYSYSLDDSQPGDFFSIDVKDGNRGNGPVFSLRGGQSMCPWEQGYVTKYFMPGTPLSESTIRRELPDIDVEPAFADNVPAHQPAKFKLKMRNASPTGDIQWYALRVIDQTNPYGAKLSIDGATVNRVFEIPAGTTLEKTLHLTKSDSDHYEIKLMLYSTCEYDGFQNGAAIYATDTITISAHFVPACSPVSVRMPDDLWVVNVSDNNMIQVQVEDYQLEDPGLQNIQLQYKPSFTSTWNGITTLWKTVPNGSNDPQIPAGSSIASYLWNIEELPDGPYDIRAVSHCTNTNNDYPSPDVSGIIDRIRPHAFGNPQPADGVLDPNDEIMIQFNEIINPASVMTSDFDVRAVLNGSPLRHETSIELDGVNDFVDIPAGTRIGDHPFTIEMWVKRSSNGPQLLWSQGEAVDSSMALGFDTNNKLFFRQHNATITSNATVLADGQWYHIVLTCNENNQVKFYLTGVVQTGGFLNSFVPIPGNMVFGKTAWGDGSFFHGNMHEARIWRTELTSGMIQSQMLKKLSGSETSLSTLWPMDEGMGSVLREVVRKKNAVLNGNWSVLPSGKSLVFGGNYLIDAVAGSMVFSNQHSFTLEFWLKGSKNGAVQTILSNGKGDGTDGNDSGWTISADDEGKLVIEHGGQQFIVIEKDVLNNNWHHIAIVLNRRGNLNTYLDGQLQASLFGNAFGEFGGPSLWIGQRGWFDGTVEMHDQSFGGALDEIRVWNTKLTAENIRASMNNRLAGTEFGLQLYLPFETYSDLGGIPVLTQSIEDQSPFARDITISGPPMYQEEDPNIKLVAPFEKVNFTYSINGDRIIITPTTDPLRIEKTVLFISLQNVQDIYGNSMAGPVNWTAYVNQNQLQWEEDELFFEKPEKESFTFDSKIINSGGIELSYEILGLPDWLTASPSVGTISPVSSKTIHFEIADDVKINDYSVDVNLLSGQGYNDKLSIDLHVYGVPPTWAIDPAQFSQSMSIVADLDIQGELSEDELDRIVAYVNGDVRGLATLEYMPELDRYLAFMEVYSNGASGEVITFKVWDAGTSTTYAGVNIKIGNLTYPQIPFAANTLVGNAVTPARWIVTNDIIQEIPINQGWTWISFNVNSALFNNLDQFFAELTFENNDQVFSQTKSSAYNPSSGWQGNLNNEGLSFNKMYKCDFSYADILRVSGPRVNPLSNPVIIATGWNWIPYLSIEKIEINEALSSYAASSGDQVKSQDQLAVYHPTQGWVGTLKSMEPGKGYMLYAAIPGSITYPLVSQGGPAVDPVQNQQSVALNWRNADHGLIDPQPFNMTVIARLESDMQFEHPPVIAAFASGHLLQIAEAIPMDGENEPYYYFTLQGNDVNAAVYFEVYDADGNYAGSVAEEIVWDADVKTGNHGDPFILHLRETLLPDVSVYPNPFDQSVKVKIEAIASGEIELNIFDSQGKMIHSAKHFLNRPGVHFLDWNGTGLKSSPVSSGTYFLEIIQGSEVCRKKLVKI